MEQDKIRISNWFTNPKEFKKLVSYSIDWKKYKSVPSTFRSTTEDLKFFNQTFIKRITKLLIQDIYYNDSFGLQFYTKDELKLIRKDMKKYSTDEYLKYLWDNKMGKIFKEHYLKHKNLIESLNAEKESSIDPFFNSSNFKITKEVIDSNSKNKKEINFYCNGLLIGTYKKYPEYFCSIKNGVRSNIRNIVKVASRLDWNQENLKTICNNPNISTYKSSGEGSFKDGYPDTSWGYTGPEMPTTKSILERIKESYVLPNN